MKVEYINGIPVDVITLDEIVSSLPLLEKTGKRQTFISINPQIAVHAEKYPAIIALINEATHRIPDGIGIVKVSRNQGGTITERVAGIDLMYQLLDYANQNKKSVFLYGAKPEILNKTIENIKRSYPNIVIAGGIDGYTDLTNDEIIYEMNQTAPTFVFVALGFPKQELWLAENYKKVQATFFQDVGGSFDVISGEVKRAPNIVVKLNLEWLYRSLANPKRLSRIFELPIFLRQSKKWFKNQQGKTKEK